MSTAAFGRPTAASLRPPAAQRGQCCGLRPPNASSAAAFGNVGSLLCFNLGSADAATTAEQLGPDLTPRDLMSLPKYTACARLLIDGQSARPFSMRTILQSLPLREPG